MSYIKEIKVIIITKKKKDNKYILEIEKNVHKIKGLFTLTLSPLWDYIDNDNRRNVAEIEKLLNETKKILKILKTN